jgi:hypothetical protein
MPEKNIEVHFDYAESASAERHAGIIDNAFDLSHGGNGESFDIDVVGFGSVSIALNVGENREQQLNRIALSDLSCEDRLDVLNVTIAALTALRDYWCRNPQARKSQFRKE